MKTDNVNTSTISLVRVYLTLQFVSNNTLRTVNLQLTSGGAGGDRNTISSVPSGTNNYRVFLSAESGGVPIGNWIYTNIQWGANVVLTLNEGYYILEV